MKNSEKAIHAREIEEFLFCRVRWKKSDIEPPDLRGAYQLRERLLRYLSYDLPKLERPYLMTPPQKLAIRIATFFCVSIFSNIFLSFLSFFTLLVLLITLTATSPYILQAILDRRAYKKHDEELKLAMQHLEKEKTELFRKIFAPKQVFACGYEFSYRKDKDDWEEQEEVYYRFILYDDEIRIELDEENKICRVILDRSDEELPYYIPMAHKYHILRVEAQARIIETYFPGYQIKTKIWYKDKVSKYGQFKDEKKVTKELNYILRTIHDKNQKTIPITYRCLRCPYVKDCNYATKEAQNFYESAANL